MNEKKQRYIVNNLVNSPDLLGRCIDIIKPSFFEPELIPEVTFLLNYHVTHNTNPSVDLMNAETNTDIPYTTVNIPIDEIEYCATEIESFCKQSAMRDAIMDSYELINAEEFGEIYKKVSDALNVSLKTDLGLNVFDNPKQTLTNLLDDLEYISCGIPSLDAVMGDGTARKMLYMVSANSGGGKSVMLSNIANNYVLQGLDVCYISFELPADMIFLRQAFIMTSFSHKVWKSKIPEIAEVMSGFKTYGAGDFRIIRMPIGSNANSIRSYIKQYELENGKPPDVLVVDYLDLMTPLGGVKNMSISEQDRSKSQEIYELLHTYDMIGWSASQQNRDAIKMASPDHSVIAGGMSKIDICDYWISLFMDSAMRLEGNMMAYFLKTRYSAGSDDKVMLKFDNQSLKISDYTGPVNANELLKNIDKYNTRSDNPTGLEHSFISSATRAGQLELPGIQEISDDRLDATLNKLRGDVADFTGEDDHLLDLIESSEDEQDNDDSITSLLDIMNPLQIN